DSGWIADYGSRRVQEGHEPTALVECDEVVATAHVGVADEDLRHRASAGDLHHGLPLGGVQVDANFVDQLDAALLEEHLGADAIRAHLRGVHLHECHRVALRTTPGTSRSAGWHRATPTGRPPMRGCSRIPVSAGYRPRAMRARPWGTTPRAARPCSLAGPSTIR